MGSKFGALKTIDPKWVQLLVQATKHIYVHWGRQRRAECFSLLREISPFRSNLKIGCMFSRFVHPSNLSSRDGHRRGRAELHHKGGHHTSYPTLVGGGRQRGVGGIPTGVGGIGRCLSGCLRRLRSPRSTEIRYLGRCRHGTVVAGRGQALPASPRPSSAH